MLFTGKAACQALPSADHSACNTSCMICAGSPRNSRWRELQVRYPDRIMLIRGNHESRQITQVGSLTVPGDLPARAALHCATGLCMAQLPKLVLVHLNQQCCTRGARWCRTSCPRAGRTSAEGGVVPFAHGGGVAPVVLSSALAGSGASCACASTAQSMCGGTAQTSLTTSGEQP